MRLTQNPRRAIDRATSPVFARPRRTRRRRRCRLLIPGACAHATAGWLPASRAAVQLPAQAASLRADQRMGPEKDAGNKSRGERDGTRLEGPAGWHRLSQDRHNETSVVFFVASRVSRRVEWLKLKTRRSACYGTGLRDEPVFKDRPVGRTIGSVHRGNRARRCRDLDQTRGGGGDKYAQKSK